MPIYEFYCSDCRDKFEVLTSYEASQAEMLCATCYGTNVRKLLSIFARPVCTGGEDDFGGAGDFGDGEDFTEDRPMPRGAALPDCTLRTSAASGPGIHRRHDCV